MRINIDIYLCVVIRKDLSIISRFNFYNGAIYQPDPPEMIDDELLLVAAVRPSQTSKSPNGAIATRSKSCGGVVHHHFTHCMYTCIYCIYLYICQIGKSADALLDIYHACIDRPMMAITQMLNELKHGADYRLSYRRVSQRHSRNIYYVQRECCITERRWLQHRALFVIVSFYDSLSETSVVYGGTTRFVIPRQSLKL